MAVLKTSQIGPGEYVNIVLKADQRSGKLSTGRVSEILTRGDHPRGIKVRLADGRVGRVQSLSTAADQSIAAQTLPWDLSSSGIPSGPSDYPKQLSGRVGSGGKKGRFSLREDHKEGPNPLESQSLADYIKSPASSKSVSSLVCCDQEDTIQIQLEKDFPKLDTALIAAILADHDDADGARSVLASLS